MSDYLGRLFSRDELDEERERRERENLFGFLESGSPGSSQDFRNASNPLADVVRGGSDPDEPAYERNFFERVFAPFEGPQQTIFSLIRGVDDDGFQLTDISRAFKHGWEYANPFGDTEPIMADEVGDILFGDDTKHWRSLGRNVAISLLFDPLVIAPLAKAGRLIGTGTKAGDAITAFRRTAGEQVGGALSAAGRATLGERRFEQLSTIIGQNFIDRNWGLPQQFQMELQAYEQGVQKWRFRAANILKEMEKLGGVEAHRLMANALESDAFYNVAVKGSKATEYQRAFDGFVNRMTDMGIHEDTFLSIYRKARTLDDDIGELLAKSGVISRTELTDLQGKHLRRMFQAFERPREYLDRVQALTVPDQRISISQLQANLNKYRKEIETGFKNIPDSAIGTADDLIPGAFTVGERRWVGQYGVTEDALFNPNMTREERKALSNTFRNRIRMDPTVEDLFVAARATENSKEAGALASQGLALARKEGKEDYVSAFRDLMRDISPTSASGKVPVSASRYFTVEEGRRRFRPDRLAEDVQGYLDTNPNASIDEVFNHVQNDLMNGVKLPEKFMASLGDHITSASIDLKGLKEQYVGILENMAYGNKIQWKPFRENLEKVSQRVELPEEFREALGYVEEAGPRIAAEATEAGQLGELRKFLDNISGVVRDDETGEIIEVAGTRLLSKNREDIGGAAVRITTGALGEHIQGMWARPSVAHTLQKFETAFAPSDMVDKLAWKGLELMKKGTSWFKLFKTVLDPTAQARNFFGNMVLADISGVNPFIGKGNLVRAANELLEYRNAGKVGKYLQKAQDAGSTIFQSTFSKEELGFIADDLARARKAFRETEDVQEGLRAVYEGIQKRARRGVDIAAESYQFNEEMFKLTSFISRYEEHVGNLVRRGKKITPELDRTIAQQAAEYANKALFDYSDMPYVMDFARKYGVVPFLAFPFKATGRTAEVLFSNPHRILKYPRVVRDINDEYSPTPDQVRAEIEALPEWVRDNMVVKLPFKDDFDREQYIDISYFMPWFSIKDIGKAIGDTVGFKADSGGAIGTDTMFYPPGLAIVNGFVTGKDSLGRPLWNQGDSTEQKFLGLADFLWESLVPPNALGGSRSKSIANALQASITAEKRPQPLKQLAVRGLTGPFESEAGGLDELLRPPSSQGNMVGGTFGGNEAVGYLQSLFGMNTVGSDPIKAWSATTGKAQANLSELQRERAAIAQNPNLSREEKVKRINAIQVKINQVRRDEADQLQRIF